MNHIRSNIILFCLSLLLICFSWATPTPTPTHTPKPTPKPEIIYNHFRTLAWMNPMDGLSFSQSPLTDPAFKDTPIFANPRFRSPFYAYDKSRPLYFLQSTNGTKTIFATLDLSQLPDLPLILLQNSSSGELSAKVYADDLKSFPGGSYRLINFTDQALTVKFNDLSLDIAPKSDQVCVPEAKTGNVQLQLLKTGSKSIIYSNLFTYNVSVRWIFFLVENDAKEISFLRLSDSVSTAQAPTPTPTPSPTHIPKKHHKPKPN